MTILKDLARVALVAGLVPYSLAFEFPSHFNETKYGKANVSASQDIYSAQFAAISKYDGKSNGEGYGSTKAPDGAEYTSFQINPDGPEEIPAFISKDLNKSTIEHIYIVLHGKLRNGNEYWSIFDNAIKKAREDNFTATDREMAVLAPQFFSKKEDPGKYTKTQLAWDDLNAWEPGAQAIHPSNTTLTSFDAIDGLIKIYADKSQYPRLANLTVVGHGGGGQLAQRYSALAQDPPDHVHVRYIHGDPSSCIYFTEDRPILHEADVSDQTCHSQNIWRYGFDEFPGTGGKKLTPKEYFKQYLTRDIISIVGMNDTRSSQGDTSCMAQVQGGTKRRSRNLIWFRYINTLARTEEDLDGFPGEFSDLPDWSDVVGGKSLIRLVAVEGVAHDAEDLFMGDLGRQALFNHGDIDEGWRPGKEGQDEYF